MGEEPITADDALAFVVAAIEAATGERPVTMFVPELLEKWRRREVGLSEKALAALAEFAAGVCLRHVEFDFTPGVDQWACWASGIKGCMGTGATRQEAYDDLAKSLPIYLASAARVGGLPSGAPLVALDRPHTTTGGAWGGPMTLLDKARELLRSMEEPDIAYPNGDPDAPLLRALIARCEAAEAALNATPGTADQAQAWNAWRALVAQQEW